MLVIKAKAETLAFYHSYNLQIKLENREKPPIRTIYLFLIAEQEVLKKFIQKNLNIGFIQLTSFSYKTLVLFIKKKNSSLYLYINF